MNRILKRIICSLLVATLPFGSTLADAPKANNAKVTLVYQHELPNVPGKSIKGVLVEYGPGGSSPGHLHPKSAFIYATVLEGEILSQVNDGPATTYLAGQSFSEMPGDRHAVSANASQTKAGQAPRGVRGGHQRDGADDPVGELRVNTVRAEMLPRSSGGAAAAPWPRSAGHLLEEEATAPWREPTVTLQSRTCCEPSKKR
jgi:quercetin dioxygenase-like cupin family protein